MDNEYTRTKVNPEAKNIYPKAIRNNIQGIR